MSHASPVKALIFDFSGVILFPQDPHYRASLNSLHRSLTDHNPDYPFMAHFRINTELLDFIKQTKVPRYIFTSGYIQDAEAIRPVLNQIFDTIFSADRLGVHKSDPTAFKLICREIGLGPGDVLFIDDAGSNISAAQSAGLQTHHYTGNQDLFAALRQLGLTSGAQP